MRKVLLGLAGLFVVVIIGLFVFISQIDVSEYKDQALAQVEKATGRKVSIEGELDLSLSLNPAIVAEGIRFANDDWGSKPDMAIIKRVEVQVGLLPLLSGDIEINRFILIEPDLLLEKNSTGKGNWEMGEAAADNSDASGDMTAIDIGTVLIRQLKLVYKDAASEKPMELSIDTLELKTSDDKQLDISLVAALDKNEIEVDGKVGSLAMLFDNDEYPVNVKAKVGALETTLEGVVSEPLKGKGINLAASATVSNLNKLNALAGSELPDIGPFALSARLSDGDNSYHMNDMKLTLSETSVSGKLSANVSGKVPSIKASLHSPLLNLVPFQPEPPAEEEKVERYLTDEVLPLDGLKAANANIQIKVDEIQTRQAQINNFSAGITLQGGNLSIKPMTLDIGGGKLSGNIKLDASQKNAVVAVNLDGKKIQLGQLHTLKETLNGGPTDLTIRFSGTGNTSQAIAGGANGKLLVKVGNAELKQAEKKSGFLASLGELLNPFSKKDNSALECAVLNFNISNGIATANKGIGVETKQITVSGGGEINLKNEKLALGFEPNATGAVAGTLTNLASGMKAGGTLADPKIKINPAGVAMGAIKSVAGGAGSIVGGLFGKGGGNAKDTAPCNTALTGKATPTKTSAKKSTSKTDVKEALKDPKKLLKGLFD
ncbi:MAG: AsmA family protein [Gammaproteobacteria bacterium]|nr:AsmA family protein [Gammaproteobacteria bacterium]